MQMCPGGLTVCVCVLRVQLIQARGPPAAGLLYPPTVLCGVAPASPCVASPTPGPLLPLMTFRSNTEGVTLGRLTQEKNTYKENVYYVEKIEKSRA